MSLQTDQIRSDYVAEKAAWYWLELHPQKKAENLTGQVKCAAPDIFNVEHGEYEKKKAMKGVRKIRKSIKEGTAVPDGAPHRIVETGKVVAKKRKFKPQNAAGLEILSEGIKAGRIVTVADLAPLDKKIIFALVTQLRKELNILTLTQGSQKRAVAWVSADILKIKDSILTAQKRA